MFKFRLDKEVVRKILRVIKAGLVGGTVGNPEPGEMCVQSAVCYALGLEHSDQPHNHKCVGEKVNEVGICLNDMNWSCDAARAEGMKRFAVAQMGSNVIDQEAFEEAMEDIEGYEGGFLSEPEGDAGKRKLVGQVVAILKKMKSPGCQYLDLCNEKTVPCSGKGADHAIES